MKITRKQTAIRTGVFVIGAAGLLAIGGNTITRPPPVTENRLVNVTPENLEPAQPDIANLLDMINMGE